MKYQSYNPNRTTFGPIGHYTSVSYCLNKFEEWLGESIVKYLEDLAVEDPWSSLNNASDLLEDEADLDNFSELEINQLESALNFFKTSAKTQFELTEQQQRILDQKIQFLLNAAKRQNKSEWKFFAYGVLTSIGINLSFDHEQGKQLFILFLEAIGQVSAIGILPPFP